MPTKDLEKGTGCVGLYMGKIMFWFLLEYLMTAPL
jgi:hypothetical protein